MLAFYLHFDSSCPRQVTVRVCQSHHKCSLPGIGPLMQDHSAGVAAANLALVRWHMNGAYPSPVL